MKILFIKFSFLSFILLLTVHSLTAQDNSIRGIVTDYSDGQILEGVNVILLDENEVQVQGTVTDRNGFYRFGNVVLGSYKIRFSYIGYSTEIKEINLEGTDSIITLSASLQVDNELLDELVVTVESEAARLTGGHQRVSAVDLSRVVTPAAGGDMASYLQALPGVVSAGDRGGQLFVRGGTPSENMVLVDGLPIYKPFHIVGFFSAFPEDILANADFYAGGFTPRYNGRISSVLDVQLRDGDFRNTTGAASISPFLAEIRMEGPLKEGESSWIGAIRSSQIERSSRFFMGETQPLRFESQYLKFSQFSDDGTRCSLMAMRTYDRGKLDFTDGDSFRWTNFVFGGKCTYLSQDPDLYIEFSSGLSYLSNAMGGSSETFLESSLSRVTTDLAISQYVGDVRLDYGLHTHMKWMSYDIEELFQIPSSEQDVLISVGGHIESSIRLGSKIYIRPGVVMSHYTSIYRPSIEPRFRFTWQPFGSENQELNASVGIYRQALAGISDLRDAGSAFIAWLPTPNENRMEAVHYLLGWQQRFGSGVQISMEGYHKDLRNLPITVWSTIAEFTSEIAFANGEVFGADVRLEYSSRSFYGFIGYGYSWTTYESVQDSFSEWFGTPIQKYHPGHDRRHQINSMLSVDIGKNTVGIRWQLGTGLPYTRQMGFDGILPFDRGLPNVRTSYGRPRAILDRPFAGRTPIYHRLDVSLERSFKLKFARLDLQTGAINSYDQTNLFYYDLFTQKRIDQLPFAPYASLKMVL